MPTDIALAAVLCALKERGVAARPLTILAGALALGLTEEAAVEVALLAGAD